MARNPQTAREQLCAEARAVLGSRDISQRALRGLGRMAPARQTEAARLMVAAGCYSAPYTRALVAASYRPSVSGPRNDARIPMHPRKRAGANREISYLAAQLEKLSGLGGADLITLAVSSQYAGRLLANIRVRKYLEKKWPATLKSIEGLVNEVLPDSTCFAEACDCSKRAH